ncbi:Leo1-like protein-domain-containing protein [Aspergillus cavernicola]|uniref:Leo1-like protein-domain-containing protein n=1 Tax=Aspergillus cavernicola TaxID=176166 RepID=A0ABR4IW42_9EURO
MSSSDEDVVRRPARSGAGQTLSNAGSEPGSPAIASDAGNMNGIDDHDADLFGSDGSEGGFNQDTDRPKRTLDDAELDSADDEQRYDRVGDRMDYEDGGEGDFQETVNIMDLSLSRAPEPSTSHGEVYTMPVPNFLSIETEEFNPETYVPPPYSTAATSLCWRFDPNDQSLLQSNARIIRWEDGSMTLQLASAPKEQYRIATKPLAPLNKSGDYDTKLDSHVYLGAAAETSGVFRLTSHLTHGLTVYPTTVETDDAVQRLQESLAAATRGGKKTVDGSAPVIEVKEDPELAKRQAELAEREKLKAARRREQLADREMDRGRRFGMSHRTGGAGLTVGGLEDDDGLLTTRPRAKKPRRPNRRGEIYTDDEEDYDRRGRTKEDEYDEDDGFLVGSDEELEVGDEDDEDILEDEDMDAEGEDEVAPPSRQKEKRASPDSKPAAGAGSPPARKKNRYVVDDDDEE